MNSVVKFNHILVSFFCGLILSLFTHLPLSATIRHVGPGRVYTTLSQAIAVTKSGDTILVHEGTYPGGLYFENLQGTASDWILITSASSETVIFNGGSNSWHLTDAAYLHIRGIIFQRQTGNGLNMDDGGSYATPAHHILFENCIFRDIQATGNNDLLKLSGVDHFEIKNCVFLNGSPGGSGIDMVGCHDGLIKGNRFENQGSNSVQAKGGCKNIRIEANLFKNGGQRTVNLGGSTGLQFFRPVDARYEASDLKVYSNIFIGSDAPVAFVGCIQSEVVNNTFYLPKKWVIRILQETVDATRFYSCGNNSFRNNIVYRDNQVSTDCNIGPNTDPQSFTFSNNVWYHSQYPGWTGPNLPVNDGNIITGKNPLFTNAASDDFSLEKLSPAIGKGRDVPQPVSDFSGRTFLSPRSVGAFEGGASLGLPEVSDSSRIVYTNPVNGLFTIYGIQYPVEVKIFNFSGKVMFSGKLETHNTPLHLPAGIYFLQVEGQRATYKLIVR